MRINPAARELVAKVVYYGPGLAGKTTNLQALRDAAPAGTASDLVTVDTHSERTLHFDMLALDLGEVQGHKVRIEFFTVPGQSYYAATRRAVLAGTDAIVFVADGRREALDENIEAMNEMLDNLRQQGLSESMPVVLQYNKQDLPTALRREQLDPLMNVRSWPSFAAVATRGEGVKETAQALLARLAELAARVEVPTIPQEPAPARTWLISCWRCQNMLEVPDVRTGAVYTCGVCSSVMEVTDGERGATRAPAPTPAATAGAPPSAMRTPLPVPAPTQRPPSKVMRADEDSNYTMRALPDAEAPAGGALDVRSAPAAAGESPSELEGFTVVSTLDETPLGRRQLVRETATGRAYRCLQLSDALLRQPGYREGIDPYVRMAGPLKHPHILGLASMRSTRSGGICLLSAEAAGHEPLSHVLARRRALAPPHAMGIVRMVALALEEAARHGVVHGWLRPDAILLAPDGNVLVDELALPKNPRLLLRELSGASAATEYYLAPEFLSDEPRLDIRTDMFLLGAVLFRMLTGEGLVTGYNAHEALHKMQANGPRPLRNAGNAFSRDLESFYRTLVAIDRGHRFENYGRLLSTLERFGGGAKRQTLRLTQSVNRPPSGAVAGRRPRSSGTGVHVRRPVSSATGRPIGDSGMTPPPRAAVRGGDGGSGTIVTVVVVSLVVAAIAGGAYVMWDQHRRTQAANAAAEAEQREKMEQFHKLGQARTQQAQTATAAAAVALPAAVAPAATAAPAQASLTPLQRRDLKEEIADHLLRDRYQRALDMVPRFDLAEDRDQQRSLIASRLQARKKDLETRAAGDRDLAAVERDLDQAALLWGTPGDDRWAQALLVQVRARRAGSAPAPVEPAEPAPAATVARSEPSPAAPTATVPALVLRPQAERGSDVGDPAALAAAQVLRALAALHHPQALQAVAGMDPGWPEQALLRRMVEWWARRADLIDRAARARVAGLRATNPMSKETCDASGANATGVELASPGGARSLLPWAQLPIRDVAGLVAAAASGLKDATPDDHAAAITANLVAGDPVMAMVHWRKNRGALGLALSSELEAAIALFRRAEAALLAQRGLDAVKNWNPKVVAEIAAELRKPDHANTPAALAVLPKLADSLREPSERPAQRDQVGFDAADELLSFPERSGNWQVVGGRAIAISESSRLARRDAATARSAQVIFVPPASPRGLLLIDFRGLRVAVDLGSQQWTASGPGVKAGGAHACALVPEAPNTLYVERRDGDFTVQFNNGASETVAMAEAGTSLIIAIEGVAGLALDDIGLTRGAGGDPLKGKREALRKLGWEPIGGALLDEGAVVLPPAAPGSASGIAAPVQPGVVGYSFEVRGVGKLRLQLGPTTAANADAEMVELELGDDPSRPTPLTVRWSDSTLRLLDGTGKELYAAPLKRIHAQFAIYALGKATIALPLRPVRP